MELHPDDVAEALAASGDVSSISGIIDRTGLLASSVYAGYGEIIEFLDVFETVVNRYRSLYGAAIEGMTRKIAQLMRWRFFFFQSRTVFLSAFIEKYLDILQISSKDTRDGFRRYVQQVTADWDGYQARRRAQAGA